MPDVELEPSGRGPKPGARDDDADDEKKWWDEHGGPYGNGKM